MGNRKQVVGSIQAKFTDHYLQKRDTVSQVRQVWRGLGGSTPQNKLGGGFPPPETPGPCLCKARPGPLLSLAVQAGKGCGGWTSSVQGSAPFPPWCWMPSIQGPTPFLLQPCGPRRGCRNLAPLPSSSKFQRRGWVGGIGRGSYPCSSP